MDILYPVILAIHNILRWAIVVLGAYVLYRTFGGWLNNRVWNEDDKKAGTFFTIALDSQLLMGLILYFVLSPITKAFFTNLSAGMSNDTIRFFGIEHFFIMLIGIALAHYASTLSKKGISSTEKFKRSAILYSITLLLILLGVPWTTRPLLPF